MIMHGKTCIKIIMIDYNSGPLRPCVNNEENLSHFHLVNMIF